MKIRNFFALILTSVILVACSNDETDDSGGIVTDPTGKAWISLSIKTTNSGNGLRALNGQDPGTPAESDVVKVRAIFFDQNEDVLSDSELTLTQAGNPGQPSGSAGEPFEINAASQYVMIIVNPASSFPGSFSQGLPVTTVNAAISASASNLTDPSTGFMMTNAKGYLEPSDVNGNLQALTLYKTKALAGSNPPLTIKVDRLVAKVRLYAAGAPAASAPNALVSNIGWILNVTNKQYFPMSERIKTKLETVTPFDDYGLGSYRIDPNYDHTVGPITYPNAAYTANYNYFDSNSALPSFANPVDDTTPGAPEYCLENTQRKEDNNFEYTTQVLVKAQYLPASYQVYGGGTTSTQGDGGDWFQISGAAYTYASLMTYISKELEFKYASPNPATYSTPRADALNNYMTAIAVTPVSIPATGSPGDETAVITAFQNKKAEIQANANRAGTYGTFAYYAGGINYYKIAIKHDNDDTDANKNELGEFGVVRNSVYDVKITKFNNPGYPVIPDPIPDPVDTDESWLSVQIDINPWTWYVQEEEL